MSKRGDYIRNPITNRPVKIGGRTWTKLVKDGTLEDVMDEKVIYKMEDADNDDTLKGMIEKFNATLPPDQHAVRGRGRYKNKLVKRSRMITTARKSKAKHRKEIASEYDNIISRLKNREYDEESERFLLNCINEGTLDNYIESALKSQTDDNESQMNVYRAPTSFPQEEPDPTPESSDDPDEEEEGEDSDYIESDEESESSDEDDSDLDYGDYDD